MYSTTTIDLKVLAARQFKEYLTSANANTQTYLTYGKVDAWPNEPIPELANSTVAQVYEVWENMVGAKKLTSGDVKHVVPRSVWTYNSVYTSYDHLNEDIYNDGVRFFIVNREKNVYKCLYNNNGANSVFEPLTVSTNTTVQTADGYIWKYMYTLDQLEETRYSSTNFMPVKTLDIDNGSLQWQVQQSAVDGAIHSIVIANNGTNYTNTSNLIVSVSGDGYGASATASINLVSKTISSIYMSSIGEGYSFADVSISGGGGTGATARAIISPPGGHGADPLFELGGRYLLLTQQFENVESGLLPPVNNFRQVSLLLNPLVRTTGNVSSNSVISQTTDITLAGESIDYEQDEWVYQGISLATATFKGKVVEWDDNSGLIRLVNVVGNPSSASLIGANSVASRFITSYKLSDLTPHSGRFIYINNITTINRNRGQTEDFKIILKF